jgi:uncharacterized membrane protein YqaE (UPF0057 family)
MLIFYLNFAMFLASINSVHSKKDAKKVARRIRLFLVLPVPFWKFDFGISIILSLVLHFPTFLYVLHALSQDYCINILLSAHAFLPSNAR